MRKKLKSFEVEFPFRIKKVNTGFEYKWDSNFIFTGEAHNSWEFVCVLDGEVEVIEEQKVYRLCRGNLIAHAPMEFHRIKSSGGTSPHLFVLSFVHTGKMPSTLSDGMFFLSPEEIEEFTDIMKGIRKALYYDETEVGCENVILLEAFIIKLLRRHSPHDVFADSKGAENYRRIIEIMKNGLYDNLSLEEISQRSAMSVSTIKSLFRTFAGIGPKTYYSKMRATEAMRLLSEGKSVEETSDLLSFSSVSYFSFFYKKHFGKPPSVHKK